MRPLFTDEYTIRTRSASHRIVSVQNRTSVTSGANIRGVVEGEAVDYSQWTASKGHGSVIKYLGLSKNNITVPDIGGRFYSEYASTSHTAFSPPARVANGFRYSDADLYPVQPSVVIPEAIQPASQFEMFAYGNKAKRSVNPVNPNVSLFQGFSELYRDGIPKMVGLEALRQKTRIAKSSGSEYLNVEFGWKPLVADVRNTVEALRKASRILRFASQNRGKPIHRSFHFPQLSTSTVEPYGSVSRPWPTTHATNQGIGSGEKTRSIDTLWDVWFSGCFTFFVSPDMASGFAKYEAQADRLLGTRLTPATLWEIAPWSWLVDWHVDFGAMLGNLSAAILDGSVMWYGYIMSHKRTSVTFTHSSLPPGFNQIAYSSVKQREKARPFGFGMNPALDYSDRQISILAALGLSRLD